MNNLLLLSTAVALSSALSAQNILVNPDLTPDLAGYEAFASFTQGGAAINSAWGLADAPVIALGDGSATFGMNDQLANADPFWSGASQLMVFQQNFWTSDNNASVPFGGLAYGETFTFTGNAVISEAYASGNAGEVFVQFLDKSYNATFQNIVDLSTLPAGGIFSFSTLIPSDADLNIIQVGFRNSGIEGTAGEMTVSNLSVAVIPEPSAFGLIGGLFALGFIVRRRR